MDIIQSVFSISEEFMQSPKHVSVGEDGVLKTAELMKNSGIEKFSFFNNGRSFTDKEIMTAIYQELLGNAINYCFWYGKYNVRPGGSSSNLMHKLLERCFGRFGIFTKELVDYYVSLLTEYRFPLLEERIKHLNELVPSIDKFVRMVFASKEFLDVLFETLVKLFPGYGSDIFLKRASLFFIQLNRRFGWWEDLISSLPIPADYQVPKMLECHSCIVYSKDLKNKISRSELIPKHSLEECEIRAATVLVGRRLSELTGWSVSDVDSWFWLRRNECRNPFHLTITTDY